MNYQPKYDLVQNYRIRLSVVRNGHTPRIYVGVYKDREEAEQVFNSFKDKNVLETLKQVYFFNVDKVLIVDKIQAKYTRCSCGQNVPKELMNQHLASKQHKINEILTPFNSFDTPYNRQLQSYTCKACNRVLSCVYKNQHEKSKIHLKNEEKLNENRHILLFE